MLRRLIAVLVMGFVLFGTIAPAVACVAQASAHGCCHSDSNPPCDKQGDGSTSTVTCCDAAPPTAATLNEPRQQAAQLLHDSGAPDPVVAMAWLATLAASPPTLSPPTNAVVPVWSDGELTYLRTGRLRL